MRKERAIIHWATVRDAVARILGAPSAWTVGVAAPILLFALSAHAAVPKSVQSGAVTLSGTSATATLSPAVDMTKAFLVCSFRSNSSDADLGTVSGQITNASTVTFQRKDSGTAIEIQWYVAEFTSGVTVQRGSRVVAGSASHNVALTSVDLSKSFPIISYRADPVGIGYHEETWARATITTPTNLNLSFQQAPTGTGVATVEWQVIEYDDASVQTGDVTFSGTSVTDAVTAVDITKSWLVFSHEVTPAFGDPVDDLLVRGVVTNATTLTFDRDGGGGSIDPLTWYLVEFTDGTQVQHGSQNFSTVSTQEDIAISSVDLTRSIAAAGYVAAEGKSNDTGNIPGVAWVTADLTSPTNLQLTRAVTSSATADIGWFVIEFGRLPFPFTKRAFLADGTPIADASTLPRGTVVKFLLYLNNDTAVPITDLSIQDVLDSAFAYQTGTIKVDNSVANCAATTCTGVEEAAIFASVDAQAAGTDAVDGDAVSYTGGTFTIDVGDQNAANAQLDVAANTVLAILLTVKMQ